MSATAAMAELAAVGVSKFTDRDYKPGKIIHIVLFDFADDAPAGTLTEVTERFLALASSKRHDGEPYIVSIEAGTQDSAEAAAEHGYRLGFVVTFASEGDRNYYVGAPIVTDPAHVDADHHRFKEFVGPLLDPRGSVLVFDFTSGRVEDGDGDGGRL